MSVTNYCIDKTESDSGLSLSRACCRFLLVLDRLQDANHGRPVSLTVEDWERETGLSPDTLTRVRQKLMLSGLIRLSAQSGRWTYALDEVMS